MRCIFTWKYLKKIYLFKYLVKYLVRNIFLTSAISGMMFVQQETLDIDTFIRRGDSLANELEKLFFQHKWLKNTQIEKLLRDNPFILWYLLRLHVKMTSKRSQN